MERIFFIGDIHGCSKTFRKLVKERIAIKKYDRLYCVGDYIDRGNDSKDVVDFILELREDNYQIYTLRGNHEQMLLDSTRGKEEFSLWLMNGGDTTLRDFKVDSIDELNPVYYDFFRETVHYILEDGFIAVHAGLNFDKPDPLEDKYSMIWTRDFHVDKSFLDRRLLIHGHTPRERDYIISQDFKNSFNIDGGCVYKNLYGMGNLFALDFHQQKLIEVPNID